MTDPLAWPIQEELVDCLTVAFNDGQHPDPPKLICHRSGNGSTIPQINPATKVNECCGGLAWARLMTFYPTTGDRQLSVADTTDNCFHMQALRIEIGALRCWPHAGKYASCEDWAANANLVDEDGAALRRAIKCCFVPGHADDGIRVIQGSWAAAGISGQCVGGIIPLTIGPFTTGALDCCATSP